MDCLWHCGSLKKQKKRTHVSSKESSHIMFGFHTVISLAFKFQIMSHLHAYCLCTDKTIHIHFTYFCIISTYIHIFDFIFTRLIFRFCSMAARACREHRLYCRGLPYGCPIWMIQEACQNLGVAPQAVYVMRNAVPWNTLKKYCEKIFDTLKV